MRKMDGPRLGLWSDEDEAAWQALHGNPPARPPSDDGLEQWLLGMLLLNDVPLPDNLTPGMFVDPVHGVIYDAMTKSSAAGQTVDVVSATEWLSDEPKMEEVGGTAYLGQLASAALASEQRVGEVDDAAVTICELAHARHLLTYLDSLRELIRANEELIRDPGSHGRGSGRAKAHALAMDLTGIARDVLDRSLGWA